MSMQSKPEEKDSLKHLTLQAPLWPESTPDFQEPRAMLSRCCLGDIWSLGRHRLACINSLDELAVFRLLCGQTPAMVWADPPYGINVVRHSGTTSGQGHTKLCRPTIYPPVIGDDSTETAMRSFQFCNRLWPTARQIWWGANYYASLLPASRCWIVWDKQTQGDFADAELAWCNDTRSVRIFRHMWNGALRASEREARRVHPTQKPIALAEWAFQQYGKPHDVIFDPFLGSGISILAAERLRDRTVYGCELSPQYRAITLTRWEAMTGQTAQIMEHIEETALEVYP